MLFAFIKFSNFYISDLQKSFLKERKRFPGEDDLHGSMEGLLRLQETYQLDTMKLSGGNVKGGIDSPYGWQCTKKG